jgi:large subunit ribosomal protein L13
MEKEMEIGYKTKSYRIGDRERKWYVIDASGKTLGRIASKVAVLLRGKLEARYTPHNDSGGYVVVINAGKVRVSGKKLERKEYFHYTGYPGGARRESYRGVIGRKPERVIEEAVRGMLPKNRIGGRLFRKLKVYAGSEHPHGAQRPIGVEI